MIIESIISWFTLQFTSNPVFAGLFGGGIVGGLIFFLKQLPKHIIEWFSSIFIVQATITNENTIFNVFNDWFHQHIFLKNKYRKNVFIKTERSEDTGLRTIYFSPGFGIHIFFWNKIPIFLKFSAEDTQKSQVTYFTRYNYTLFMFALTNRKLNEFMNYVLESYESINENKVLINSYHKNEWIESSKREKRPISSIFFDNQEEIKLLARIKEFKNDKEWYIKNGIPYKLGVLLYGSPGCGKSSLIFTIASEMNMNIAFLSLDSIDSESDLTRAFANVPPNSILVIEDIDTFACSEQRVAQSSSNDDNIAELNSTISKFNRNAISLSALLNTTDGVLTPDGALFIYTTNYKDKLDDALIRKGRIDIETEIKPISGKTISRMCKSFYPDLDLHENIFDGIIAKPSQVQDILFQNKYSKENIVKEILNLKQ